jgi:hypothetical protein
MYEVCLPALTFVCRPLLQQHEAAVLLGERGAATALLEALWLWHTAASNGQQQQQPGWLKQHGLAHRALA